jgi:hypothetical protein
VTNPVTPSPDPLEVLRETLYFWVGDPESKEAADAALTTLRDELSLERGRRKTLEKLLALSPTEEP